MKSSVLKGKKFNRGKRGERGERAGEGKRKGGEMENERDKGRGLGGGGKGLVGGGKVLGSNLLLQ